MDAFPFTYFCGLKDFSKKMEKEQGSPERWFVHNVWSSFPGGPFYICVRHSLMLVKDIPRFDSWYIFGFGLPAENCQTYCPVFCV